ncbi:MAG: hypothetical protein ACRDIY_06265 [Chloroflexota bacterium]
MKRIAPGRLRQLTLGLGVGTLVVGIIPWIAPRQCARAFGIPLAESPAADVAIRSVSARDAINGIGILSATIHGGRVAPWILARALSDGTDTLAIGIAWTAGARNARLSALGAVALGATALDVVLYLAHKANARALPPGSGSAPL